MFKKLTRFVLFLVILFAIALFFVYGKYKQLLDQPITDKTDKQVFVIDDGLSAYEVVTKLAQEKLINQTQELVLKIYMKYEKTPEFKKGTFRVPLNTPLKDLVTVLETPELTDVWVTIPEGLRKDEIAKIIAQSYQGKDGAVFSEKEFLKLTKDYEYIQGLGFTGVKDLEGYLFPDKYLLPIQATTDYVVRTLTTNFRIKVGKITYSQLTIASMLEREGLNDNDRPMISDVIRKRIRDGWLLQVDATLLYYYKDWKHVITQEDENLNQPYNTYKNTGLPPTPICNPGLSAINAARNPKKNPYYFYIHDNSGNVYFATTLEEHNANVAKYLR